MTITEAADDLDQNTSMEHGLGLACLQVLVMAGLSITQAAGIVKAYADGLGAVAFTQAIAEALGTPGPERRKGAARLLCGHEITSTYCSECGNHVQIVPGDR